MARQRRTSAVLETARQRLAGLKKIDPAPNLGPNLSIQGYEGVINGLGAVSDSHNQLAAQMDDSSNAFDAKEAETADFSRRILSAVEAQFGPDSSEYEMVGGTRKSERKSRVRKGPSADQRRRRNLLLGILLSPSAAPWILAARTENCR